MRHRRGKRAGRTESPELQPVSDAELEAMISKKPAEVYRALVDSSPIESEVHREVGAEVIVTLLMQLRALRGAIGVGGLASEESKTLSGLASNVRRGLDDLKTRVKEKEEEW